MADTISTASDTDLLAMMTQISVMMTAHAADYPAITVAMKSDFDTLKDLFNDKINAKNATLAADRAATIDKNNVRDQVETFIRRIRSLNKAGGVAEDKQAALGIPTGSGPTSPTATVPIAMVDTSKRLQHTVNFSDAADPSIKRRPRGTVGCEIWTKVAAVGEAPPADEKDCTFLALDTATPYVVGFDDSQIGKMAHYLLRWQLRDGSRTPFGEVVSATITG